MTAFAVVVVVLAATPAGPTTRPADVDLGQPTAVYHVASDLPKQRLDPSGLYLHKGKLLAVADKFDRAIFEVVIGDGVAVMRPYRWLNPWDVKNLRRSGRLTRLNLDLEGISGDGEDLYVVAENSRRVLRVDTDGDVTLVGPDFNALNKQHAWDLFRGGNAGLEGLCVHGRTLYVANERSKAAILMTSLPRNPRAGVAEPLSKPAPSKGPETVVGRSARSRSVSRPPQGVRWAPFPREHLTDLCWYGDRLYALNRLGREIIEVDVSRFPFKPGRRYGFARATTQPRYQYRGMAAVAGLAEGLAIDDRHVYVLLDNNGQALRSNPRDRRSLLFVFPTPAEMKRLAPTSRPGNGMTFPTIPSPVEEAGPADRD